MSLLSFLCGMARNSFLRALLLWPGKVVLRRAGAPFRSCFLHWVPSVFTERRRAAGPIIESSLGNGARAKNVVVKNPFSLPCSHLGPRLFADASNFFCAQVAFRGQREPSGWCDRSKNAGGRNNVAISHLPCCGSVTHGSLKSLNSRATKMFAAGTTW